MTNSIKGVMLKEGHENRQTIKKATNNKYLGVTIFKDATAEKDLFPKN